jgi:preprotein translocase subunit YajC
MVLMLQLVMIFAIFYFLLIRPQRKERQRHQKMLGKLSRGDQVMTNGGILGVIVHATEQALTIRTAENTRIVVDRGHIGRRIEEE